MTASEVAILRAEVAALSAEVAAMRRVVDLFYEAGRADALGITRRPRAGAAAGTWRLSASHAREADRTC